MSRRKIVTTEIDEDTGIATLTFWSAPDSDGTQVTEGTATVDPDKFHSSLAGQLMLMGFQSVFGNQYNRLDDPEPAAVRDILDKLLPTMLDGTWTPGRRFAEAEPTLLELAIAEATGQPVHLVQKRIDEEVWRVGPADKSAPFGTGEPKRDKRGRVARVFTKRYLDNLANDPRVRPILARLTAEHAKRLGAKRSDDAPSTIGDLFGSGDGAQAEAAN